MTKLSYYADKIFWKMRRKMPRNWSQHPESIPDTVIEELADDLDSISESLIVSAASPDNSNERMDDLLRHWIQNRSANGELSDASDN